MNQESSYTQQYRYVPINSGRSALADITSHTSRQAVYVRKDSRGQYSGVNSAKQIQNYPTSDYHRPSQAATLSGAVNNQKQLDLSLQQKGKVDKTKYKTEMCKNWIETGQCRYGNKCQFAHGNVEVICKEPSNTKYKSKLCKQFHEKFFCPYGRRCLFKHEDRQLPELVNYHSVISMIALEERSNDMKV